VFEKDLNHVVQRVRTEFVSQGFEDSGVNDIRGGLVIANGIVTRCGCSWCLRHPPMQHVDQLAAANRLLDEIVHARLEASVAA